MSMMKGNQRSQKGPLGNDNFWEAAIPSYKSHTKNSKVLHGLLSHKTIMTAMERESLGLP